MDKSVRDRLCSTIVSDLLTFPHLSFNDYLSQLLFAESRRVALAAQHARNLAIAKENQIRSATIAKQNQARNALIAHLNLMKSGARIVRTELPGDRTISDQLHATPAKVENIPAVKSDGLFTNDLPSQPHFKLLEDMPKTDLDTELLNLIRSFE